MYKQTFRQLAKRLMAYIPSRDKQDALHTIEDILYTTDMWKQAETIAITIPREQELDTHQIINKAWKEGKKVAIPKCYPKQDHDMKFFEYTNRLELENVYLDLYEPKTDEVRYIAPSQIDLLFVPGLLFDQQGYRIGYGGGYYDRYLPNFHQTTISLAMEEQLVNSIPSDKLDQPVDYIISNQNLLTPYKERL
ncbi:5-formyltetrahydrofolate cyclo-ligase [Alkalibacillus almallahensis]|uniref:5-formyltetrahydrofolate cyclo-ligase n=1 Tax=Alkalibacillus almallahensis TaxID=1379154 RepID=UPI001423EC24|nr:5-formyltetrahydrofolate cyclo-ligase [Alkalibacillus almallahensis]NIK13382.1 5-formyltetrahydrofolate cyclo-ligase [Alkalibacillus almallahensis]